jgi:hypothetical protein
MPHGRHIKDERRFFFETSLSTVAAIKLGTQPSPPPRPVTYSTREPTPTHTTHTTRNTREFKKMYFVLRKRALSSARHVLEDTSHQTQPQNVSQLSQACCGGHITPNPTPKSMCVIPLCLWGVQTRLDLTMPYERWRC